MAWAIITNYTSKCAQMDPQQPMKTSKFYSRSKKCDIEKTLGGWVQPLGSPKVNTTKHYSAASEGLAQGPYMGARVRFEHATLRTQGIEPTTELPHPTPSLDGTCMNRTEKEHWFDI